MRSNEMEEWFFLDLRVMTNKKQNKIIKSDNDNSFKVELKAKPVEGRANHELIKFLSKFLEISQNQIEIVKGSHSRNKVVRIQMTGKDKFLEKINRIQSP